MSKLSLEVMQGKVSLPGSDSLPGKSFPIKEGFLCQRKVYLLGKSSCCLFREEISYQERVSLSGKQTFPCPRREVNLSLPQKGRFSSQRREEKVFSEKKWKGSLPEKEYLSREKMFPQTKMTISDSKRGSQIGKLFPEFPIWETFPGWNIHLF